jgi:hypothetical protein
MSGPQRRRPAATSGIATLVPHVEEIQTSPAAAPNQAPAESSPAPAAPRSARARSQRAVPARAAAKPEPAEEKEEISRTFKFDKDMILRAETAVLRTTALPGGYRSMVALINDALREKLGRLADEFNDGEPFPPNEGKYRTGRTIGS